MLLLLHLSLGREGRSLRSSQDVKLEEDREYCFEAKRKYNILPGKSFGTLPYEQHAPYLRARCHRFFCKPHPMAGKGVYECEPLTET